MRDDFGKLGPGETDQSDAATESDLAHRPSGPGRDSSPAMRPPVKPPDRRTGRGQRDLLICDFFHKKNRKAERAWPIASHGWMTRQLMPRIMDHFIPFK